tara:strand:- start:1080 stop:1745 length:666 start_codon:yes stop_codon:yes gene_type:complete
VKRQIIQTADGSKTLYIPDFEEHYHSIHGALSEAQHVFVKHGLKSIPKTKLSILEMGFGTGLNAYLTCLENRKLHNEITYTALEAYPINPDLANKMEYIGLLGFEDEEAVFQYMHQCSWNDVHMIDQHFTLQKIESTIQNVVFQNTFDLVYYDAFAPRVQPELWTEEIFAKILSVMNVGAILVTYCAKGSVKRALKAVGFEVESLEGPARKREMTRAKKTK